MTEAQAARKKAEDERDTVKKSNETLTTANITLTTNLEKALEASKAKAAEVPPKKKEEPTPEAKVAVEKPKDESKPTPSAADVVSPKGDVAPLVDLPTAAYWPKCGFGFVPENGKCVPL